MPDHGVGFHPVGPPQRGQRQLHPHQHRLNPLDADHRLPHRPTPAQRKPDLRNENRLQLGDRRGERRLIGQQLPAHPRPLRSLTRIHEHRARAQPDRHARPPRPSRAGPRPPPATPPPPAHGHAHTPTANRRMPRPVMIQRVRHIGQRHLAPAPSNQSANTAAHDATRSTRLARHHQRGHRRRRHRRPPGPAAAGPARPPHAHSSRRGRTTTPRPGADPRPPAIGRFRWERRTGSVPGRWPGSTG